MERWEVVDRALREHVDVLRLGDDGLELSCMCGGMEPVPAKPRMIMDGPPNPWRRHRAEAVLAAMDGEDGRRRMAGEFAALLEEAHDRIGEPPTGPPLTVQDIRDVLERLRQKGVASPPGSTEPGERGEAARGDADGSGAQRGAQGAQ